MKSRARWQRTDISCLFPTCAYRFDRLQMRSDLFYVYFRCKRRNSGAVDIYRGLQEVKRRAKENCSYIDKFFSFYTRNESNQGIAKRAFFWHVPPPVQTLRPR